MVAYRPQDMALPEGNRSGGRCQRGLCFRVVPSALPAARHIFYGGDGPLIRGVNLILLTGFWRRWICGGQASATWTRLETRIRPGRGLFPRGHGALLCWPLPSLRGEVGIAIPPQRPPGKRLRRQQDCGIAWSRVPAAPNPRLSRPETSVSGCPGPAGYLGGPHLKALSSLAWHPDQATGLWGEGLGRRLGGGGFGERGRHTHDRPGPIRRQRRFRCWWSGRHLRVPHQPFPASGAATGIFNGLHPKRELSPVDASPGA
jgi:hypothetical protein